MKRVLCFSLFLLYNWIFGFDITSNIKELELKNVNVSYGKNGIVELSLTKRHISPIYGKDILYLGFDGSDILPGGFSIKKSNFIYNIYNSWYGKASAKFLGFEREIIIEDKNITIKDDINGFSIGFAIYPMFITYNGELFKYKYIGVNDGKVSYIKAALNNNKVVWKIKNIFYAMHPGNLPTPFDIRVVIDNPVKLNKWEYYTLTYDNIKKLILIYRNGSVVYERMLPPYISIMTHNGKYPVISMGNGYTGNIDEVVFTPFVITNIATGIRYYNNGSILSPVYRFSRKAYIADIKLQAKTNNANNIYLFYRISDIPFSRYNTSIKWIELKDDSPNIYGRFFQLKALLFGENGYQTPILNSIRFNVVEVPPPYKPIITNCKQIGKSIALKWKTEYEGNIKGYKIYYGYESKNYFGSDAIEGISPIFVKGNINNYRLSGLKRYRLYYISMTAIGDGGESDFSPEVVIRVR